MPSGIYFSQENMQTALNLIVQYLRDSGYTGSLEDGTGISDIVLKPSAMLYSLFSQQLEKAKAYQSITKADELRKTIGEAEYDAAIDSLMSNWFVSRNAGFPCVGTVRLYFLALPSTLIRFSKGQTVAYTASYALQASDTCSYVKEDFAVIMNANGIDEYYIDVPVQSSVNTSDAPREGDTFAANITHAYYKRATAAANFTPGEAIESSDNFINRTKYAITTRELITERAVQTVLPESYPDIKHIFIARNGSPELLRDLVTFESISLHVGNMADIYLATDPTINYETLLVSVDGTLTNSGNQLYPGLMFPSDSTGYVYIFKDAWICDNNGKPLSEDADAYLEIALNKQTTGANSTEVFWGSIRLIDDNYDELGNHMFPGEFRAFKKSDGSELPQGTQVRIRTLITTLTRKIDNLVSSTDQRIICYDPMVKHKFPIVTEIRITVIPVDSAEDDEVIQQVKESVAAYVRSLTTTGENFTQSEMVAQLHADVPSIRKVALPVGTVFTIFDPKDSVWKTMETTEGQGYFNALTDLPDDRSCQITNNTVQFYTDVDNIHVTISRG